ncbi:caspase family protein [Nocardia sp. NPDC006630]|uniref:caspase, EACC1-associated type n=1 Tax=Nocardia sp. NPDC006630 TaxID=3157181 RepID=UPI0033B304DE
MLIGSGTHTQPSAWPDIPAVAGTIADLARTLVARCGVRPEETLISLLDPTDPMRLYAELSVAAHEATDVLVLYYIGHGVLDVDMQLHLSTRATDHLTEQRYKALPYQYVRDILGTCTARTIVVVLDCCFAGSAQVSFAQPASEAFKLDAATGAYLLSAAAPTQAAYAPPGDGHTAFTGALIRLLEDGDPLEGPAWDCPEFG